MIFLDTIEWKTTLAVEFNDERGTTNSEQDNRLISFEGLVSDSFNRKEQRNKYGTCSNTAMSYQLNWYENCS